MRSQQHGAGAAVGPGHDGDEVEELLPVLPVGQGKGGRVRAGIRLQAKLGQAAGEESARAGVAGAANHAPVRRG